MNERDVTRDLEAWLADPAPSLDDTVLFQTIDRIPSVPQRRRWWPFRWFPLGLGATRSARPPGPHPERRSTSMFTATRVAAGVAILALTGSLAFAAGLSDSTSVTPVPAAVTEEPLPDRSPGDAITGAMHLGTGTYGETTTVDDREEMRGSTWTSKWTSDDPRLAGAGTFVIDTNTYHAEDGTEVAAGWAELTLQNDGGTWNSLAPAAGFGIGEFGRSAFWLDGADGYEGQSAFVIQDLAWTSVGAPYYEFEAWIVPGDAHLSQMYD